MGCGSRRLRAPMKSCVLSVGSVCGLGSWWWKVNEAFAVTLRSRVNDGAPAGAVGELRVAVN